MKEEILIHWQIQEGLLQSYRNLFLTSQSIIFSIAAIIATSSSPNLLVFGTLLFLGIVLLKYWYSICGARGLDVSYFQNELIKLENRSLGNSDISSNKNNLMTEFKEWQAKKRSEKLEELEKGYHQISKTRRTLEFIVPLLFAFLWLILLAVVLYQFFEINFYNLKGLI
jgi:hypothetical protein